MASKKSLKEEKNENKSASYTAQDITVLEGLDPVRKRPGMYIGTTDIAGLHHLVWEVVDNAIDEAMAGHAQNITVELLADNRVAVTDDGRGIPVEKHKQTKKSTLETVLTVLHAGGKFGGAGYKVSGGLHGVGVSVVNALSEYLCAEVRRDGFLYTQEYQRGKPKGAVKKVGKAKGSGTKIIFQPDPEIFETVEFNSKTIIERLRRQAFLTKGVHLNFIDHRTTPAIYYGFYFDGGLLSFIRHLNESSKQLQSEIFYVEKSAEDVQVEAAFIYNDEIETQELSFANNIHNPDGGMHLTGFRSALTRTLNSWAIENNYLKEKDSNLTGDDIREGLVAIVSVKLKDPQFEGQTKGRLGSPEARTATESIVSEALRNFLERNSRDAGKILEKCLLAAKARKAAKAARDTVLRKGALDGLALPGKLTDCITKHPEEAELFIVEGDSAGGSAKMGRNKFTQAILPLRGKPLNVEKARIDRMLANKEIKSLVVAFGTAIAENFDIEKLRYHKIIILSDADVDGRHITTLLLTLFYRYFPKLIENGHIYVAQPPLYSITQGKETHYIFNEDEKEGMMKSIAKAKGLDPETATEEELKKMKINVQRYKGLGEMNADQLAETTMDSANRVLKQINVADAEEADKLFNVLMGEEVAPRSKFIQSHALSARNLDV
ncbi:MAG: DNA topoisomerase (ATP-hydrolyzing) subunit B [Candidatus Harrisonbacteria bacterium CG10_big_fil_rev_8_21_14_0_10_44_23]|uniref:DNA topoisomerase (ATP-hydrolyzing) n=1 Tax=Candidatus Harrisonbacteria bacterium CG10_big_fil_rev_8_21_14_0_10_44_23 TaxID=1974585 RepID=A0A2H0UQD7_9BACT|nr:MAG: DNA topoisomerase (ATP-hydrolyzing) subunit B [Candidatus Harrisonbacteria bacterium CG10_big_fil_rev_8_21_14_0_10_44_23]